MTSLIKAKLIAQGGGDDIEFMFNPTELDFSRIMNLNRSDGARTDEGLPTRSSAPIWAARASGRSGADAL